MSGVYKATNQPNKAEGYCVINEEGNVSAGKIELNRLDSHITFKIAVGSEVKTFTPISWQVKNVPLKSTVFPQKKVYLPTQMILQKKVLFPKHSEQ